MHCCSFRLRVTRNLIMTRLGLWTWLSAFLPIYYGTPTIPDKIFGTKYRIPVILDRKRKVCYPFLQDFWLLLSKLNFLKRDWVPGFVSTQIWDFSNISLFPRILSPKSYANSFGNVYTRFAILDIKFGFTCFTKILWSSKILWPGLSENFLFALYISNDDSNFWKKCSFGSEKLVLSKKFQ